MSNCRWRQSAARKRGPTFVLRARFASAWVLGFAVVLCLWGSASFAGGRLGTLTPLEAYVDGESGVDGLLGALGLAISPDGAHVYAAGAMDDAVAVFARDAATGLLTFVESQVNGERGVTGLDGAAGIAVSPDGGHVYVASVGDNAIAVFARDSGSGALTFVQSLFNEVDGVQGLMGVISLVVSPDGKDVYAVSPDEGAITAFSRNAASGELTFQQANFDDVDSVDGLGGAYSVAISPDGLHLYAAALNDSAVSVFARSPEDGLLSFVEAEFDGVDGVSGLEEADAVVVTPDGAHVYVAGYFGESIAAFSRDASTGALTFLEAQFDGANGVTGLAGATSVVVSPDGAHVYVTGYTNGTLQVFARQTKDNPSDVDGSGSVDAVDVQLVINAALGIQTGFDCDINGDGGVDALDVQLVINAALGIS